jgi:hypothetical protein
MATTNRTPTKIHVPREDGPTGVSSPGVGGAGLGPGVGPGGPGVAVVNVAHPDRGLSPVAFHDDTATLYRVVGLRWARLNVEAVPFVDSASAQDPHDGPAHTVSFEVYPGAFTQKRLIDVARGVPVVRDPGAYGTPIVLPATQADSAPIPDELYAATRNE